MVPISWPNIMLKNFMDESINAEEDSALATLKGEEKSVRSDESVLFYSASHIFAPPRILSHENNLERKILLEKSNLCQIFVRKPFHEA